MLEKIHEGAWLIRLPVPWELESVNAFLFRQSDGWMLLDCGLHSDRTYEIFEKALEELGLDWRSIVRIVISHMHPDHVGGAPRIRKLSGAPIVMHPAEARLIAPRDPGEAFFEKTERYLRRHGVPEDLIEQMRSDSEKFSKRSVRFLADEPLREGDVFEYAGGTIEAVLAPGHSPALICFLDRPNQTLFSTDAVLEKITPNIGVHPFYDSNPLGEYLNTLAMLDGLDVRLVVPGHGKPFEGLSEWIARTKRHHRRRCDQIAETLADGERTGFDVAGDIWGSERPPSHTRMAMAEGLSHLMFLSRSGEVERVERESVDYWRRAS